MLVNRNRNDSACELTLTIWNRNLQLCLGSDPSPSSAPCKVCPEHLPASRTAPYAFSTQHSTLSPRQPLHHPPPGAQIPFDSPQAVLALRVFGRALPYPTAEFLQLHKPSASLFLPAQLMCPTPTPSPSTAVLRPVPGTPSVFVLPESTASAQGQQSITLSLAHLCQQCRQNSLLLSRRVAETHPSRAHRHQLIPRSLLAGMHQDQNSAAGMQLLMARASPEPPGSMFYHSCQRSAWPPILPGHKLLQQASHAWGWAQPRSVPWAASGTSNGAKNRTSSFQPLTVEALLQQQLVACIACCLQAASCRRRSHGSRAAGSIPNPQDRQA